jgi:predicted amidophosphoribosyltransferase
MFQRMVDLLFPPQCASCREPGNGLCVRCVSQGTSVYRRLHTLDVRALGSYRGGLRLAVLALKDGRRDVAEALGERLAPFLRKASILVPVPTTPARRRARGMDGVDLIARRISEIRQARVFAVLRRLSGAAQHGRSGEERRSARGRYFCDAEVAGRSVLLVDDVCTTGTTLEDCADAIRAAGGSVREAIVVASADDDV